MDEMVSWDRCSISFLQLRVLTGVGVWEPYGRCWFVLNDCLWIIVCILPSGCLIISPSFYQMNGTCFPFLNAYAKLYILEKVVYNIKKVARKQCLSVIPCVSSDKPHPHMDLDYALHHSGVLCNPSIGFLVTWYCEFATYPYKLRSGWAPILLYSCNMQLYFPTINT